MIRDCAGKIIEDEEALAVTSGLITKALTLSSMILTSKNEQLLIWIGITLFLAAPVYYHAAQTVLLPYSAL